MAHPVRVLIADAHPVSRFALKRTIEEQGLSVCAETEDAPAAIDAALEHRPDLCLLDAEMPGGGVAAAEKITENLPGTPIIMLSATLDEEEFFAALRAGASGYLSKEAHLARLPAAVKTVLEDEPVLPGFLVRRVIDRFRNGMGRHLRLSETNEVDLTEREWQVLDLMRRGFPTRDIARQLLVSPATVRSHVSSILKKVGMTDRRQVIDLLDSEARA